MWPDRYRTRDLWLLRQMRYPAQHLPTSQQQQPSNNSLFIVLINFCVIGMVSLGLYQKEKKTYQEWCHDTG